MEDWNKMFINLNNRNLKPFVPLIFLNLYDTLQELTIRDHITASEFYNLISSICGKPII